MLTINGVRPLLLNKRDLVVVFRSPDLVQRMLAASRNCEDRWLTIVRDGVDILVCTDSAEAAKERLQRGEYPPQFPSRLRGKQAPSDQMVRESD